MGLLDRARDRLAGRAAASSADRSDALVQRMDALEAMVEGLQDAVDRQARRHDERMNELARRLEPGALARALSDDARKRGI